MRRLWKTGVSLLLAVSLVLGNMPITAQAAKTAKTQNKEEKDIKETKRKKKSQEDVELYADGEAIILYDTSAAKTTKSALSSMDGNIEIVQTYDFEDAKVSAQSANTQNGGGISVSLVKSDKLSTDELVKQLSNRKDIRYAEPNYRIKATDIDTDDYSAYQWALDNDGQNKGTPGFDVNADSINTDENEEEIVIALLDTGIDYSHEDLEDVVWKNLDESVKFKGEHGYDFINNDADPLDDNGHGTHCAGIMAAADNGKGVSGVATSNNVKIMALKILDNQGYGYGMEAVGAYNYIYKAQQEDVNVVAINNSWGNEAYVNSFILQWLIEMVGENGAISVCAAGNSAKDNDTVSFIPANIDSPYVISVAASNEKDELASFSNYGAKNVDIAAPGTNILSTVADDCFNPGIYQDKDKLCSVYEDFSKVEKLKQTIDDDGYMEEGAEDDDVDDDGTFIYGISAYGGEGTSTIKLTDENYFGECIDGAQSLQWNIKDAKAGEMYYLYFPYTVTEKDKNHSVSVMASVTGPASSGRLDPLWGFELKSVLYVCDGPLNENGIYDEQGETVLSGGTDITLDNNYWKHYSGTIPVRKGETRALAIQVYAEADGDYTVNLDDFGMSKNGVTSEDFGKYDYYNGTSMATPHVTGAVAALANAYPDDDALTVKARLLGSNRKSESLTGMVSTGGILDLSNKDNPNMSVDSVVMYEGNLIGINGSFLKDAMVKLNGDQVETLEHSDNCIWIDGTDYVNKSVTISLTKGENEQDSISLTRFFAMGQPFECGGFTDGSLSEGNVVSDGNALYHISESGIVSIGVPTEIEGMKSFTWESGDMEFRPDSFGDDYILNFEGYVTNLTDVVYGNGKLWTVAKLDVGYSECTAVLSYDSMHGWTNVAEVPAKLNNVEGYSIACYNGEVYLLGGYDYGTQKLSTEVYKYVPKEEIWEDEDSEITGEIEEEEIEQEETNWDIVASLPEGRVYAKTLQVDDKLVVTLGGSDSGNEFGNLIFDGEKWTQGKKSVTIKSGIDTYTFGNKEINVADAQIGIVDGGIVYTDSFAENLGDTYIYDMATDTYETTGYMLDSATLSAYYDHMYATTVQNDLYVVLGCSSNNWIEAYTMPVDTGFVQLVDESEEGVQLMNAGYYIPGDTVPLTFVTEADYFVKSVTVDGKELETFDGITFPYTIPANADVIEVSGKLGAFVTEISIPERQEIAPGQIVQLKTEILPANAENQELFWFSEDEDIVFVDEEGNITASEDAKIGTELIITAVAMDRGEIMAECTVVITEEGAEVDPPADPNPPETNDKPADPNPPATNDKPADPNPPATNDKPADPNPPATNDKPADNTEEKVTPAVGYKVKLNKCTYKVLKNTAKSKTVAFVSLNNKNATKVTVPKTVKINNQTFKVTQVSDNAFKNCKKLTKITIGKNVTSLGKNVFKNCKKLKTITVQSTKITKIGKNTISKKVTIKVPKSAKSKYKRLFKNAGYKGTVK